MRSGYDQIILYVPRTELRANGTVRTTQVLIIGYAAAALRRSARLPDLVPLDPADPGPITPYNQAPNDWLFHLQSDSAGRVGDHLNALNFGDGT